MIVPKCLMRVLLPLSLAGLLAACTTGPHVVDQSNPSITYRYDGTDTAGAKRQADAYCAGFGRTARLVNTGRSDGDYLATFDCR